MTGPNTIQECSVGWIIKLRIVIEGDNEPLVFLRRERRELASLSEDRGNNRDLVYKAGCRKLSVESKVIIAHQQREYDLRVRRLNSTNGGSKVNLVEWEELGGNNLSTLLLNKLLHPHGGDLTEVVVGRYRVKLLAKVFHRVRNECRPDLLRWNFA